jgi:hypothetical protein
MLNLLVRKETARLLKVKVEARVDVERKFDSFRVKMVVSRFQIIFGLSEATPILEKLLISWRVAKLQVKVK